MFAVLEQVLGASFSLISHTLFGPIELLPDIKLFFAASPNQGINMTDLFLVALRSTVIYFVALMMVRIGEARLLGRNMVFDIVIGIILGSVLSRAINGSASLVPTIVACIVLVGMRYVISVLSFRSDLVSLIAKGMSSTLIRNGKIDWDMMRKNRMWERDLKSAMRLYAHLSDLEDVKEACLEREGRISIIKTSSPKILEVKVADGVQTIRIQID